MSKFLKQAVRALDKLYGFDQGPTATDQLNLPAGIQLVHNVDREAEYSSGVGVNLGWGVATTGAIVHAAIGSLATTFQFNLTTVRAAVGIGAQYDPQLHDIWLFDVSLTAAASGAFTSGFATSLGASALGQLSTRVFRRWTGELATVAGATYAIPTYRDPLPERVAFSGLTGAEVVFETTVAVGVTLTGWLLIWVGAKGVLPPHVA